MVFVCICIGSCFGCRLMIDVIAVDRLMLLVGSIDRKLMNIIITSVLYLINNMLGLGTYAQNIKFK